MLILAFKIILHKKKKKEQLLKLYLLGRHAHDLLATSIS